MDENYWREDLKARLKVFGLEAASGLMDSGFLAIWVILQWAVTECVVKRFELSGVDKWMLSAFQVVFAISTLVPIVVYVYLDIRLMVLRAQRRIRHEKELSKSRTRRSRPQKRSKQLK